MSTPFHALPAPSALRWSPDAESAIGPVWSPWPAPDVVTLKRSNVWPAPVIHTVTWAPPSIVHLMAPDPVVAAAPSLWQRFTARVRSIFGR